MNKTKLVKMVEKADNSKKANSLDLSADQDLTIGLMNLIAIERVMGICDKSDLCRMVKSVRRSLMGRILTEGTDLWGRSVRLLGDAMDLLQVANTRLAAGDTDVAYAMYEDAYGLYSLFWGLNMGMVDAKDIKNI